MKPIDSILKILVQQGGSELRLASDRAAQMFKGDSELPLTIPPMPAERICTMLDDLWTANEKELRARGRVSVPYRSAELGSFTATIQETDSGLQVSFRRADAEDATSHTASEPVPPQRQAAAAVAAHHDETQLPETLHALLKRAAGAGASDIHLSPRRPPVIRVHGALEEIEGAPSFDPSLLLGDVSQRAQLEGGVSVDQALDVAGVGRVRVNVYATEEGICAALRLLKREPPPLSDLNMPGFVEALITLPHGLIIACGPTGCGKSTTLAALAQHAMRARPQVLITLEDPIEYVIRPSSPSGLVRQREIGTHVRDFATGLRDALREDPDMLLVGEMRDATTISLALTAAETGHLVFASLHSRTAASAVERIVDTYPPERQRQIRVQLADALRAVISQRLLPTADGQGRVPAVELLRVTHGVANLIREGRTAQIVNALQAGAGEGMLVLERSLTDLVRLHRIRRETALGAANDVGTLNEYLSAARC